MIKIEALEKDTSEDYFLMCYGQKKKLTEDLFIYDGHITTNLNASTYHRALFCKFKDDTWTLSSSLEKLIK